MVGADEALYREGITVALREAGLDVVAAADNADDLRRKTRAYRPDVAIVDIDMPPRTATATVSGPRATSKPATLASPSWFCRGSWTTRSRFWAIVRKESGIS